MSNISIIRGFTLIEILVALTIVTIALSALSGGTAIINHNAAAIQERTIALWIAEDILNKNRINHQWPSVGDHAGYQSLAGNDWQWVLSIESTNTQDMYRASVRVTNPSLPDKVLSKLTTYYSTYERTFEDPQSSLPGGNK